jgi:leucyl/phenylalanyl-tRNA--protein transferase
MRDDAPLSVDDLLYGYRRGLFPMADDDGRIDWYTVDPRAVIPLDGFHRSRRLARTCRNAGFEIRIDTSFTAVMQACAASAPDRPSTWIAPSMITSYTALHQAGFAHSVEAWRGDVLVGGLYGVAIGGFFAGESMFSRERDASKVALVALVDRLRAAGFVLLDTQFLVGGHMRQFGAIEIPRADYLRQLHVATRLPVRF